MRGTAYSIGLGTHAENAQFLAYGLPHHRPASAMPCPRHQLPLLRAHRLQPARGRPSYRFAFSFDEYTKKDCFFSPLLVHEAHKEPVRKARRTEEPTH